MPSAGADTDSDCESLPADVHEPFVSHGLGSVKGLSVLEQVTWATSQAHPALGSWTDQLDGDLSDSLRFEVSTEP